LKINLNKNSVSAAAAPNEVRMFRSLFFVALGFLMTLESIASAQSSPYPPLPEAVSSFGAISSDGFVYVYGGHAGKAHTYSTETVSGTFRRLDLKHPKVWEELPSGPHLQGMNLAAHAGKIYRVGGMQPRNAPDEPADNHSVADAACYDPMTRHWTPLPPLPVPRSSHDVVALDGKLYVVGGWWMKGREQKSEWLKTAMVLDLAAKEPKWTSIEQPFQRRALCAASLDGKLFVIGGMDEQGTLTKSVDVYDPHEGKWSKVAPLPGDEANGFSPAACAMDRRLFVAAADGGVYRIDAKMKTWEKIGGLDVGRIVARLIPAGEGRLLVIGGSGGKKGNIAEIGVVDFQ
jgi:N-acetylneuraminic acid mutarotase